MIVRFWRGRVPAAKADDYHHYLERTGIPDYRSTPGNRGVWVLRRAEGDVAEFLLMTMWDSYDAIQAFAGLPLDAARYYPEDDDFLLEKEPKVMHYELVGDRP